MLDKILLFGVVGFEEIDFIVFIVVGFFCFVLIFVGLVICICEYYYCKRICIFEFVNMYQVEDFILMKILCFVVIYMEKGVDININGYSNGDVYEIEKEILMESIQFCVNFNENGLMVGIMGMLERQFIVFYLLFLFLFLGSEYLQFVFKEEELLQSQDNFIYYIDDDYSE